MMCGIRHGHNPGGGNEQSFGADDTMGRIVLTSHRQMFIKINFFIKIYSYNLVFGNAVVLFPPSTPPSSRSILPSPPAVSTAGTPRLTRHTPEIRTGLETHVYNELSSRFRSSELPWAWKRGPICNVHKPNLARYTELQAISYVSAKIHLVVPPAAPLVFCILRGVETCALR